MPRRCCSPTRRTAELTKYAANAFLATKVTFINEIADLCESVGADVQAVARGMGLDERIGVEIPACRPGLRRLVLSQGYARPDQDRAGPRGAAAHRRDGRGGERPAQARDGAQGRPTRSAASVRGKTIALLGLTFKPNTDDMREAPSIALITGAAGHGREGARLRSGRDGAGEGGAAGRRRIATGLTPAPRARTRL